jgi:hypothetical protein
MLKKLFGCKNCIEANSLLDQANHLVDRAQNEVNSFKDSAIRRNGMYEKQIDSLMKQLEIEKNAHKVTKDELLSCKTTKVIDNESRIKLIIPHFDGKEVGKDVRSRKKNSAGQVQT